MLAAKHWTVTIPTGILGLFLIYCDFTSWHTILVTGLVSILYGLELWFFRDPTRVIPTNDRVLLSPADGMIFDINTAGTETIVYIRMYVLDCHIIRMPVTGTIVTINFQKGSYWPMIPIRKGLKAATTQNARRIITIHSNEGKLFKVVQIAGTLAYRTVCYYAPTVTLAQGEKLGIIRFGSECDLHFPSADYTVTVKAGMKVKAGLTTIATKKIV